MVLGRCELAPEKVREARKLEMEYLKKQAVYEKGPTSEAFKVTGRRPIPVRWLDTEKGDPTKPNFRSQLVVKDIKATKSESEQLPQNLLFSSTPPLESMRLLCSLMSTQKLSKRGLRTKAEALDYMGHQQSTLLRHSEKDHLLYIELYPMKMCRTRNLMRRNVVYWWSPCMERRTHAIFGRVITPACWNRPT